MDMLFGGLPAAAGSLAHSGCSLNMLVGVCLLPLQDALCYGSSSAPATEQRGSRNSSMKGGRLWTSSGERGKVRHVVF
jgi:hypothetical protein